MNTINRLGIDVGSTTIKLVVVDEHNQIIYKDYVRHFSNIKETLVEELVKLKEVYNDIEVACTITGSGGITLAGQMKVPHLQEVIAVTRAIKGRAENTDVAIEIGGEDAKIIYFTGGLEQRMNGICAGGTGSFIDQMASLLKTDASGLNELAKNHEIIYPIAARCGVFAKTDIQPLINEGARREDIAASIFQAVVNQTVSGLAQGKPIKGNVCFLGGPLHFMSELKSRFIETLNLNESEVIVPEDSHLFAALGSALNAKVNPELIDTYIDRLNVEQEKNFEVTRLDALFNTEEDYKVFKERHDKNQVKRRDLATYTGNVFLGIDAGSTTTKLALISENSELLWSYYGTNEGNPLKVVQNAISDVYSLLPEGVQIKNACVTGYGEHLIKEALKVDMGEIETVAHFKGANHFNPGVDFILDIGGQDMKCLRMKDGSINTILLNEACSSGCGSFIETFAKSLNKTVQEFAALAVSAENPIDLGSRCTVFMNSRVKQAQKEGATVADISAGLSYSVIKNALQKVIKIPDPKDMGEKIVVQGGTFYNESVLRAFEIIAGREAVRPDIAGIMGAFGAAILASENQEEGRISTIIGKDDIDKLEVTYKHTRCGLCGNNCLLTINIFKGSGSGRFISGNRCERGAGKAKKNDIPNMYEFKEKRVFDYTSLSESEAPRGVIGIPRVLNMYENYPLWHTFFTKLGFRVVLSDKTTRDTYELGMESIPSESECYPAKLVHGHVQQLINDGVKTIFYPGITHETKDVAGSSNCYNCPIVISYPENIKNNVEDLREKNVRFLSPFFSLANIKAFKKRLIDEMYREFKIPQSEVRKATDAALAEFDQFKADVRAEGERVLKYLDETGQSGIVLAGRPYHVDSEINHGIPELITGFGLAVLTEDSIYHLGNVERPLQVSDQWAYHARLYETAAFVRGKDNLEIIQLNSFGCGIDAITTDEVCRILESTGKLFTCIKIDEVNNLGAARIRVRSLLAAMNERKKNGFQLSAPKPPKERVVFTKEMNAKPGHTILCPQMAPLHFNLLEPAARSEGYNLVVLEHMEKSSIDTGLKYVNNDACFPAFVVVGQIIDALKSGKYDTDNVSIVMSQTGGGCRGSSYLNFLRNGLERAGYGHIPVISIAASSEEKNPGMKYTLGFLKKAVQALTYGDTFMRVLYKTRPYEVEKGSANKLYEKWNAIAYNAITRGDFKEFTSNIYAIVDEFDKLPIHEDLVKPRVGVVGEILVKYHPTANNDIVGQLEELGAEAVVPDISDFFLYGLYDADSKHKYLGGSYKSKVINNLIIKWIDSYRKPMKDALEKSKHFYAPAPISELAEYAEPVVSICNQTGEGWFLTGEMVELIKTGAPNIVCIQPFACLPNHITGKGVIKELKRQYPISNIVAIDYDSGASEVNQLNRIKLMLTKARENIGLE